MGPGKQKVKGKEENATKKWDDGGKGFTTVSNEGEALKVRGEDEHSNGN